MKYRITTIQNEYNDYLLSNSPRFTLFVINIFLKLNSSQTIHKTYTHREIQSFHEQYIKYTNTYLHNEQGQSYKCWKFSFSNNSKHEFIFECDITRQIENSIQRHSQQEVEK